jgi:hypothetical protein
MISDVIHFLSGAIAMGFLVSAALFFRFWALTRDRFFAIFSMAFGMLFLERIVLQCISPLNEIRPYGYLIRLTAFCCILWAVIDKNRR